MENANIAPRNKTHFNCTGKKEKKYNDPRRLSSRVREREKEGGRLLDYPSSARLECARTRAIAISLGGGKEYIGVTGGTARKNSEITSRKSLFPGFLRLVF